MAPIAASLLVLVLAAVLRASPPAAAQRTSAGGGPARGAVGPRSVGRQRIGAWAVPARVLERIELGGSPWRPRGGAAVDDLAVLRAAVASGSSLEQALEAVALGRGPWSAAAEAVVLAGRRGSPLQDGLDAWASVAADAEVSLLVAALGIAGATGGSHGLALQGVADAVAERRALHREIRALSSQARASAAVLVLTPAAFAVVVALVDPRVLAFWTSSLAGPVTFLVGLALDLAGAAWMAALVRRVR